MQTVKIIRGAYGYRSGPGLSVKPVRLHQTVDLPDPEAARLVGLGVAAYMAPLVPQEPEEAGENEDEEPDMPDDKTDEDGLVGPENDTPAYSTDMRAEDLRELLSAVGLSSGGKSKAEMVAALDAYYADTEDLPPSPDVETPVM